MQLSHHDIQNKNLTLIVGSKLQKKQRYVLQLLNKVYGNNRGGSTFLESICNLLLNETKQYYVWKMFLMTRLAGRPQHIIKKVFPTLENSQFGFFGPPIPLLT